MSFIASPHLSSYTKDMCKTFLSRSEKPQPAFVRRVARRNIQELHFESVAITEYMVLVKLIVAAAKKPTAKKSG